MEPLNSSFRENAERERSALEARSLPTNILVDDLSLRRYANPPADTAFPLEYCYHLLGNIRGLTVVDYGCGFGENLVHLAKRGASVIALDVSPELIEHARRRAIAYGVEAQMIESSAYETGIRSSSVDAVFAIAIFHHLDLEAAKIELCRILKPDGIVVLQEPVRDSKFLAVVRKTFPSRTDTSAFEYPLTKTQLEQLSKGFQCDHIRRFRLPFIPVAERLCRRSVKYAYRLDAWLLQTFPFLGHFATMEVRRLKWPGPQLGVASPIEPATAGSELRV